MSSVTAMEHSPITTEQVSRLIAKTLNWKAPGPEGIYNFWIKRFTATHSYLAHYFNQFTEDAEKIPDFLVRGITYLLPKSQDYEDPSKYRPITCLCTIYKISVYSRKDLQAARNKSTTSRRTKRLYQKFPGL
jgi:hypothetical protein